MGVPLAEQGETGYLWASGAAHVGWEPSSARERGIRGHLRGLKGVPPEARER